MAAQFFNLVIENDSATIATRFGDFVENLHSALTAFPLVQTGDSGQLDDPYQVTTSSYGLKGYRVYRLDDALEGECPVYLKFEFSLVVRGSTGMRPPALTVYAGFGSDGAGNLVRPYRLTPPTYGSASSTFNITGTFPCVVTYNADTASLAVILALGAYSYDLGNFWICRTPTHEGVPGGAGFSYINQQAQGEPSFFTRTAAAQSNTALLNGGDYLEIAECSPLISRASFRSFNGLPMYQHLNIVCPHIVQVRDMAWAVGAQSYTPGDEFVMEVAGDLERWMVVGRRTWSLLPSQASWAEENGIAADTSLAIRLGPVDD